MPPKHHEVPVRTRHLPRGSQLRHGPRRAAFLLTRWAEAIVPLMFSREGAWWLPPNSDGRVGGYRHECSSFSAHAVSSLSHALTSVPMNTSASSATACSAYRGKAPSRPGDLPPNMAWTSRWNAGLASLKKVGNTRALPILACVSGKGGWY